MTGVRLKALGLGTGLSLLLASTPVAAQYASSAPAFTVRGEAIVGYQHFLASQTFKAIFNTANAPVYGGGVDIGLRHDLFIRVDATRFKKTGERAFVSNGAAYQLGIPLTVTLTPFMVSGGYRTRITRAVRVYAGGGAGSWSYKEETDDPSEGVSFRKTGFLVLGGAEWRVDKWVALGFEGQYASVPNAIGTAGVSQQYNEKDLGGTSAAARIIIGR